MTEPVSVETEAAVLSAWVHAPTFGMAWVPEVALFAVPAHRVLADAMQALAPAARDHAGLVAELVRRGELERAGGTANVFRILTLTPEVRDPWAHVRRLRQYRALRDLLAGLSTAIREGETSHDLGATIRATQHALRVTEGAAEGLPRTVQELLHAAVLAAADPAARPPRCPSGVPDFDDATGGLRRGTVAVCGAATNWGKSTLAVMMADTTLVAGLRALIVSFEDAEELYGRRLLARRARVSAYRLRECALHPDELARAEDVAHQAPPLPVFLDARGRSVETVATDVRSICASDAIDLVLVDYLQAATADTTKQDRRNEITHIARTLTDAIKTSNAAGVLFSQIRRLPHGERPSRHALKESGDLENAAEIVLVGYFDDEQRHRILVDKCKDGTCGEYALLWDSSACCFTGGHALETQAVPTVVWGDVA